MLNEQELTRNENLLTPDELQQSLAFLEYAAERTNVDAVPPEVAKIKAHIAAQAEEIDRLLRAEGAEEKP